MSEVVLDVVNSRVLQSGFLTPDGPTQRDPAWREQRTAGGKHGEAATLNILGLQSKVHFVGESDQLTLNLG